MIVWKLDDVMRRKRAKGREMARRMGIGENYLSRVRHEVPDRLSLVLLDSLCHELDCTIADLLEYRPGPSPVPAPPPPVEKPKRPAAPRRAKAAAAPEPAVVEAAPEPVAIAEAPAPAPAEAPAPVEPAAASPEAARGLSLAQQRAREVIRQAVVPEAAAPVADEPAPVSDEEKAAGAAVVRTSALQAKLDRLRRRREAP
jgi:2-oxoglutarate dehydrogenase E2 component (dihydrolipoamide succinyltransferase)